MRHLFITLNLLYNAGPIEMTRLGEFAHVCRMALIIIPVINNYQRGAPDLIMSQTSSFLLSPLFFFLNSCVCVWFCVDST